MMDVQPDGGRQTDNIADYLHVNILVKIAN